MKAKITERLSRVLENGQCTPEEFQQIKDSSPAYLANWVKNREQVPRGLFWQIQPANSPARLIAKRLRALADQIETRPKPVTHRDWKLMQFDGNYTTFIATDAPLSTDMLEDLVKVHHVHSDAEIAELKAWATGEQ